jgi:Zn-finger nucleic acid-binding protein
MHCPVCKTEMIIQELHDVEVDHCFDCDGIWLDSGELEMLLEEESTTDTLASTFRKATFSEKQRSCPVCRRPMEKVHAGDDEHAVLLDRCPKHGLWFDAGELQQILHATEGYRDSRLANLLKEMFPQ